MRLSYAVLADGESGERPVPDGAVAVFLSRATQHGQSLGDWRRRKVQCGACCGDGAVFV
jgi:hypothetical protein